MAENRRIQIEQKDHGRPPGGVMALIKGAWSDFQKDQCTERAAALCYSTIFALPPLLILLIKLAGVIWSPDQIQTSIETQFSGLIGSGGGRAVRDMVEHGYQAGHSVISTVLGIVGLLLGATGAFLSLQQALNAVWEVGPDPKAGGIKPFILKRLLSFGMVMALAFLLVASLAVTAVISALSASLGGAGVTVQIATQIVSLVILGVLFAAMFKFLPDGVIPWRAVWVGGVATAVLFELGKFVIGLYLGHSNPGNAFGGASAFAVLLVWLYYAGVLLLYGAEFTQRYAASRGHRIVPKKGAARIERQKRIVPRSLIGDAGEDVDAEEPSPRARAS